MSEGQLAELQAIIAALVARTRDGGVRWAWEPQWDDGKGRGVANLVSGRVLVEKDFGNDTVVIIEDSDSNILEKVNVGFLEYVGLKSVADELYALARRSALQVDSKLESILQEIRG